MGASAEIDRFEDLFHRVLRSSLQLSPEAMLEEWLRICTELTGATGGSILTEEGNQLEFAFSNVESLIGMSVPWDSIAGATVQNCRVIYTYAPADQRHFNGVDRQIASQTRYLLSVPIVSIHMAQNPDSPPRSHGALQLLFEDNILPDHGASKHSVEFSLEAVREQPCYEHRLKQLFWLLPNIAFGLEILRLRQTSHQVIHELKNKFVGAQSWVNCLREDIASFCPKVLEENATIAEDLDLTGSLAREGAQLAKSYLQFTKLYTPRFEETNVNDLIRQTAANLEALVAEQGGTITVETDLDGSVHPRRLDPDQVKMALFNLGKNAVEALVEASGADARIRLASEASGASMHITVGDNGPGMPERIAENLFKPFTTQKEGGTGLGLTITKKIVDTHGGRIWCETNREGTRFIIEFKLEGKRR